MSRIFISYRRDDSAGYVGHLREKLADHFGRNAIFRDIDTIEPGEDFVEAIEKAVGSCEVLIAVIGKHWLTVTDANGWRRLDNPNDFVRLEIATALDRKIRVIPVLVGSATMPSANDLPQNLQPLARRNAQEISDRNFQYDVENLIRIIGKVLGIADTQTSKLSARPEASKQIHKSQPSTHTQEKTSKSQNKITDNSQRSIVATGDTVEEAITKALTTLDAKVGDVVVEVIEEPTRGLFGKGARLAKVRVTIRR